MPETPDHRTALSARSGDDHVIDAGGELRNVEQEARDRAAAEAAAAAIGGDVSRKGRKADPEQPAD